MQAGRGGGEIAALGAGHEGEGAGRAQVATAYRVGAARRLDGGGRTADKSDRATVEQALDPRTRMVPPPPTRAHMGECMTSPEKRASEKAMRIPFMLRNEPKISGHQAV